jgi:hypothetical protein
MSEMKQFNQCRCSEVGECVHDHGEKRIQALESENSQLKLFNIHPKIKELEKELEACKAEIQLLNTRSDAWDETFAENKLLRTQLEEKKKGLSAGILLIEAWRKKGKALESRLSLSVAALKEIQWMFDGEADIDNKGNPNRAMTIDSIVGKALQNLEGGK